MKGYVTINSDASYFPTMQNGGFGIWIKHDSFVIKTHGKFKGTITDSNEAEIKALVNAFHCLDDKMIFDHTVVVNCDNKLVRNIVNKKKPKKKRTSRFDSEIAMLLSFVNKYKAVYAKDIKGHSTNHNSRNYVNNWCDKASRHFLKEENGQRILST